MATVISFTGVAIRLSDSDVGLILDFPIMETRVFYDESSGRVRFYRGGTYQQGTTVSISDTNYETVSELQSAIDSWISGFGKSGTYFELTQNSTAPVAPSSGVKLFSSANNKLEWRGVDGYKRTLENGSGISGHRVWSLPDKSGTFAMLDDISNDISASYFEFESQASAFVPVAAPDGGVRMYSPTDNEIAWIGPDGYRRRLDGTLGASRTWTLPDKSGTFAMLSDIPEEGGGGGGSGFDVRIYKSNYSLNDNDIDFTTSGSCTHNLTGGKLVVTGLSGSVLFGDPSRFRKGQLIHVFIDIEITGAGVYAQYPLNSYMTSTYGFSASGQYYFTLKREDYTYPFAASNVLCLQNYGAGATGFTLNSLEILDGGTGFNVNHHSVIIGQGAGVLYPAYDSVVIGRNASYTGTLLDGTIVGSHARSDQQNAVVIGGYADGNLDTTYGCAGGSDLVAVGYKAKAYGWRTTAIGASAGAGGQSATAFGAGAWSGASHGVAFGRGAFLNYHPPFGTGKYYDGSPLAGETRQIYFGNGWAHRFPDHPINNSEYAVNSDSYWPANNAVVIHGLDAYDSRSSPSSFNVNGGDLALFAGRGTGSGVGGKISFLTAPPSGVGQNEKNPGVVAFEIDASTGAYDGTRLLLYDLYNNTLKRVKLAAANGSNQMLLYVDGS